MKRLAGDGTPLASLRSRQRRATLRNAALGSVVALLLGLAGAVLGAWMGSGEPMTLGRRRRPLLADEDRQRRVA